jgi:hypothetical protein
MADFVICGAPVASAGLAYARFGYDFIGWTANLIAMQGINCPV